MDVFREISHQHVRHACILLSDPTNGNRRHPLVVPGPGGETTAAGRVDRQLGAASPGCSGRQNFRLSCAGEDSLAPRNYGRMSWVPVIFDLQAVRPSMAPRRSHPSRLPDPALLTQWPAIDSPRFTTLGSTPWSGEHLFDFGLLPRRRAGRLTALSSGEGQVVGHGAGAFGSVLARTIRGPASHAPLFICCSS